MSCVHTSPQNGLAERKNRHLLNVTHSLLFTHNVPKYFWGDALLTTGYLINRLPSKVLNFQSPHEKLVSLFPSALFFSNLPLKVFGCVAFVHNVPENLGTLEPRATKCMFLGYSMSHKGYRCYCPSSRKLFISRDVSFNETIPFYATTGQQEEQMSILP